MHIKVECPACEHVTRLPESAVGKETRCLSCGARLLVTGAGDMIADPPATVPGNPVGTVLASQETESEADRAVIKVDGAPSNGHLAAESTNPFAAPVAALIPHRSQVEARQRSDTLFILSQKQVNDLVSYVTTTRRAVWFFLCISTLGLLIQATRAVLVVVTLFDHEPWNPYSLAIVILVIKLLGAAGLAVTYAVVSFFLFDFGARLGDFRKSREALDLVRACYSAKNFWTWSVIVFICLMTVTISYAVFVAVYLSDL